MCFTTVNYGTFTSLVGLLFFGKIQPLDHCFILMLIIFLLLAGWVSGEKEGEVFPIVEATPIEDVGENGEIPTTFTVHFRAKVFFFYSTSLSFSILFWSFLIEYFPQ